MKNSTRKLFAIIATLTMALSVTVSQAPTLPDISTPVTGIEQAEKDAEEREPDCGTNCEDDYNENNIRKY